MPITVREEEAAAVVWQAVSLAKCQGHAQVTPLHIARVMLSAPSAGVLRAACVRSQSHPLQHSELQLRLDAALDRLAVIQYYDQQGVDPVPSNAFVAALKRAQMHQRRGRKVVELEQLIVAVLDDPSVHRVMRAAGFSGSKVRARVENAIVTSSEQSHRARSGVSTCPIPGSNKNRAGGRQPSLQTGPEIQAHVPDGSETRARQAKSGTARPDFFDGTELVATTAILPPWLRHYQNTTIPTRSTHRGTSFEVDAALRWQKFTALTAENLKMLCDALELRVPRHRHIVPGISITVLQCRSGMARRRARDRPSSSSATWLLFQGRDGNGKTTVARELARLVFGSYTEFTALQGNSDEPALSGNKLALKRRRSPDDDANGGDVGARLFEAMMENPHRVILIDGVNRLDRESEMLIKSAIVGGTMKGACNSGVVGLEDAIVVLNSDVCDSRFVVSASSPRVKRRFSRHNHEEGDAAEMERRRLSWDLNVGAVDGEEEDDCLADHDGILNLVDCVFLFN